MQRNSNIGERGEECLRGCGELGACCSEPFFLCVLGACTREVRHSLWWLDMWVLLSRHSVVRKLVSQYLKVTILALCVFHIALSIRDHGSARVRYRANVPTSTGNSNSSFAMVSGSFLAEHRQCLHFNNLCGHIRGRVRARYNWPSRPRRPVVVSLCWWFLILRTLETSKVTAVGFGTDRKRSRRCCYILLHSTQTAE